MTKVLLINPFLTVFSDDPAGITPMLSLAYLASFLEQKNVPVAILDIAAEGINQVKKIGKKTRYGLTEKQIIKRIKNYNPQIVGITCSSTLHALDALKTAQIVKIANPKILVVMGGAHPSVNPHQVLKDKNVDLVIRGEGEITLWQIIKKHKNNKIPKNILGTSVRQKRQVINNPPRPLIKNLDILPFPNRHLLPMDIYFQEEARKSNYAMRNRVMTMITSRGCPGNCVYCSVRTIWGRSWRARSAKNVVDEIESLITDFKISEIHFIDDSISVNKKRLSEICDEIIKRKLNIKWTTPNGIAIWLLDKKLILKMKKAGCYRLTFGLESGNKDVLNNFINKHYQYKKAKEIISYASQIGLWTLATFIIGFPYETRSQINDTINFSISTDLDFAVFYIANPFPGTPLYNICLKEGLLPKDGALNLVRGCKTKYFTHEELKSLQAEAFSKFLKSRLKKPWRFLSKIKSFEDLVYTYKLGKSLFKIMFNQAWLKSKGIAALRK